MTYPFEVPPINLIPHQSAISFSLSHSFSNIHFIKASSSFADNHRVFYTKTLLSLCTFCQHCSAEEYLQFHMGRHSCCYKQKLRKGLWSPEEDEKLVKHITKYGHGCWSSVPKLAGTLLSHFSVIFFLFFGNARNFLATGYGILEWNFKRFQKPNDNFIR